MSLNVMHHDAHVPTLACGPADSLIKLCRLLPLTHFKETFEALQMPGQRRGWSLRDQSSKPAPKSAKGLGQRQSCKRAGPGREARRTLTRSNLIICNSFSHVVLISGVADTGHAKSQKPTLSLRKESCWEWQCCSDLSTCRSLAQLYFYLFLITASSHISHHITLQMEFAGAPGPHGYY